MRYTIVGRNIEVTPGLREAVEDKIGKLDRYLDRKSTRLNSSHMA